MGNINSRLNQISDYYNFKSYSEFAAKAGINHQTASNYLKGKQKPDAEKLSIIIQSFDEVNAEWLLTGKGDMLKKSNQKGIYTIGKENKLSDKNLQIVIDTILKHENDLMQNPVFKQWYDNKILICENNLLKSLNRKK